MGDHLCIGPDVLAVWKGGADLGPVDNPADYPTRVRFNSKQPNMGFYPTPFTGTYTNTGWPSAQPNTRKITLFAHGLPYRPILCGTLTVAGVAQPIQGSVLHAVTASGATQVHYSYTIGADATNVYLNILRTRPHSSGSAVPSSPTISYEIWLSVYGVNSDGSIRRPAYFNGVDGFSGNVPPYLKAGEFDTAYRYPYREPSGSIIVPNGATMSVGVGWNGLGYGGPDDIEAVGLGWRYSVLGRTVQRNAGSITGFVSGASGNSSSFVASVTRMSMLVAPDGGAAIFEHDPVNGAIFRDAAGNVVWSSARQQAYWTDYVSGSFVIGEMPSIGETGIISRVTTNLAPVASNATNIMGSFTATQSGGYTDGGVSNGGIHQLGGSTFLMVATYPMYPSNPDVSDVRYTTWITGARTNVAAAMVLTTWIEGGWLKAMVERYKPTDGSGAATWSGIGSNNVTISYHGFAYTFDN